MLDMNSGNYATGTDADAKVTLAAASKPGKWSIGGIAWSYEGGTLDTDAGINVFMGTTAGVLVFSVDINDDGAGFILPAEPVKFQPAVAITVELVAGGTGVVGKINVIGSKLV